MRVLESGGGFDYQGDAAFLGWLRAVAKSYLADATGPITFAQRRERLDAAIRALEVLLPRDRRIILMLREGCTARDIAAQLAISIAAAEKARMRALNRFRRAFELHFVEGG